MLFDLGVGRLFGGHLDVDGVVARELDLGDDDAGDGERELLARLGDLGHVEVRLLDVDDVVGVDGVEGEVVDEVLCDLAICGDVAADRLLEHLARRLALAKARIVVLPQLLEVALDMLIDLFGGRLHRQDDFDILAVVLADLAHNLQCILLVQGKRASHANFRITQGRIVSVLAVNLRHNLHPWEGTPP